MRGEETAKTRFGTRVNGPRATWHPGNCPTRASVLPGHLSTRASVPGQLGTRTNGTRACVGAPVCLGINHVNTRICKNKIALPYPLVLYNDRLYPTV